MLSLALALALALKLILALTLIADELGLNLSRQTPNAKRRTPNVLLLHPADRSPRDPSDRVVIE